MPCRADGSPQARASLGNKTETERRKSHQDHLSRYSVGTTPESLRKTSRSFTYRPARCRNTPSLRSNPKSGRARQSYGSFPKAHVATLPATRRPVAPAITAVLFCIRGLDLTQQPPHFLPQPFLDFLHSAVTHGFVLARVGLHLAPVHTLVRYLWCEAAMHALGRDPKLKRFYRRKRIQKGMGKARVAAGRKLGIRLWMMMRDEIDYQEFCRRGQLRQMSGGALAGMPDSHNDPAVQ